MGRVSFEEAVLLDPRGADGYAQRTLRMQEFSDLICNRLTWLEGRDRLLVEMVYEKGFSFRMIAGVTKTRPSSVCRRIQTLISRLLSREYQICLIRRNELSGLQMDIARERYVLAMGRQAIARRHHISRYCVDRHLRHLANLIQNHLQNLTPGGGGLRKEGA